MGGRAHSPWARAGAAASGNGTDATATGMGSGVVEVVEVVDRLVFLLEFFFVG